MWQRFLNPQWTLLAVTLLFVRTVVASASAQDETTPGPAARPTKSAVGAFGSVEALGAIAADGAENAGADTTRSGRAGAVYTLSNQSDGNRVLAFDRSGNGSLAPAGSFPTGGLGSGGGLGNQSAL